MVQYFMQNNDILQIIALQKNGMNEEEDNRQQEKGEQRKRRKIMKKIKSESV